MSEERVSRSASFAFLVQLVGAALTAVLTIFLGRRLSEADFGYFTFAVGVLTIATLFADIGITSSSGRFVAERRGDRAAAASVFRTSARLKLRVGLIAGLALFALAEPICDVFDQSGAVGPLRALSITLLAQGMFLLFVGTFNALGMVRYNVLLAAVESVVEVLSSIVLVVLGAAATGAALGNAAGYTVGALAGLVVFRRVIGGLRPRGQAPAVPARAILSYAGPLLLVDAAFRVFTSIDVLLIAALVGGGAPVAAFGLAIKLSTFLEYPAAAVAVAVAPRLARWREGRHELPLFSESLRYLLIMQMLFTAPVLVWSQAILHLIFGDKYPEAPEVLQALAPFIYLSGIAQLTTLAVNYIGEAARRVPIAFVMLAVNAAIDVALLPRIGVVAGAIGTSAAYVVWVPAHLWILRRRVGLELAPLLVTVLRTCVAGVVMVGVLVALGTGVVAPGLMAVGLVVAPAAYVLTLFAVREVTPADVAKLRGIIARRVAS
jgi:O-antigen/teichoic acid export membrane protein